MFNLGRKNNILIKKECERVKATMEYQALKTKVNFETFNWDMSTFKPCTNLARLSLDARVLPNHRA